MMTEKKTRKKTPAKTAKATPPAESMGDNMEDNRGLLEHALVFHSHYIKDLSFENPNAPLILNQDRASPHVEVNFSVASSPLDGKPGHFEVKLSIQATAKQDDDVMFIIDLAYAGELALPETVDEKSVHPIVMIEGPRHLFPFARALLSTITREGGFMPLNIQPIDFARLYQMRMQRLEESRASEAGDGSAGEGGNGSA